MQVTRMIKELWLRTKRFVLPYPIAYSIKFFLKFLLWTCKFKITGIETLIELSGKSPCILMLWHNRIALAPEILTRFTKDLTFAAFVSKSRDGEPLALLVQSYKVGKTIRVGHHTRFDALKTLINHLKNKNDIVVVTPDGPRGPKYELKPGVAAAAKASNASIIPFSWTASNYWTLRTWDGFMIPKPFSTIHAVFEQPITLDNESIEEALPILKNSLHTASATVGLQE